MSAVPIDQSPSRLPSQFGVMASPQLRTLALCDLVESTALIEELGDQRGAELMRRLDRITRDCLHRHGGREIDKTDGFLVLFDRPIRAVAFALDYQRALHDLGQTEFLPLRARIGIHVGDVMLWENEPADIAQGAKPLEVEGLIKPVAARLMTLARPGQILLSGIAYSLSLRSQGELDSAQPGVVWKAHGNYRFKGVIDPVAVYEVGESKIAPLRAPPWSSKAHREVPWYRRPAMVAVEIATVITAIAVPAYTFFRSPPAIAFAQRDWVVVGDFKNLTGEAIFDGSLQTAFRIGLEQSRYVNLLSDLKVRDTLKLMQRDPAQTSIDRAVGSEIAIREGARALIMPMIAEIGGHVRVTAEVIDPKTQTTVYSESADGTGAESVLPSIDKVNKQLRMRLGEALATVSGDSMPLEKAATKNLDALKAFSLGEHAYGTGNMKDALSYYQQALRLDPDFAMVHFTIAKVYLNSGDNVAAEKEIAAAAALNDRLSARDTTYLAAWQASLSNQREAVDKWRLLSNLYADFFPGLGACSFYAWIANQYDLATSVAKMDVSPQNGNASAGHYMLGILGLAQDQYDWADREFTIAADDGIHRNDYPAMTAAARRNFKQAAALLAQGEHSGIASDDLSTYITRIAIAADQGHWSEASNVLEAGSQQAQKIGGVNPQRFAGIGLGMTDIFGKTDTAKIAAVAKTEALTASNGVDRSDAIFHTLFEAYLAMHAGDEQLAASLLATVGAPGGNSEDVTHRNLRAIIDAEHARISGDTKGALAALKPLLDGSELFLTHVELLAVYTSAKSFGEARAEAQWLIGHPGRAYGEAANHQYLTAFNIAQSDLARLSKAELSDAAEKADALRAFEQAWPEYASFPTIAERVKRLQARN